MEQPPCVSSVVSVCAAVALVGKGAQQLQQTRIRYPLSRITLPLSRASSLSPPPPLSRSAVGRLHRKTSELEKEAKISLDEKGDVRKVSAAIASTLDPRLSEYGLQLLLSGLENFTLSEAGGGGAGGSGGGIDDGSSPRGSAEEIAQLRAENEQLRARIMQLEVRMHVRRTRKGKTHRCVLYTSCCVRARVHVGGCVRGLYMRGVDLGDCHGGECVYSCMLLLRDSAAITHGAHPLRLFDQLAQQTSRLEKNTVAASAAKAWAISLSLSTVPSLSLHL